MEKNLATILISECLIHTADSHWLAPGALHHDALIKIVNCVNEVAAKRELFSFINVPSDLFLVKTSYIYYQDKNTFVLILHTTLLSPHNLLPLYKFLPLPVHFNFSRNVSVTPKVGLHNMIPVYHSKSIFIRSPKLPQDGGVLLLQGKEWPPHSPDKNMHRLALSG